jgi:hypothetical protein
VTETANPSVIELLRESARTHRREARRVVDILDQMILEGDKIVAQIPPDLAALVSVPIPMCIAEKLLNILIVDGQAMLTAHKPGPASVRFIIAGFVERGLRQAGQRDA